MPTLSFVKSKESTACAVVRGGEMNGEILYYNEKDDADVKSKFKSEISISKYADRLPVKPIERTKVMNRLLEALSKDLEPEKLIEPSGIKAIYAEMKDEASKSNDIKLPTGSCFEIVPNPNPKARQVLRISGMSGSGKSFLARSYAENYHKLFPDRPIYLVSELKKDETLDNMKGTKPQRLDLDKLVTDPIKLEDYEDNPCLIIFDDIDALKKPYDAVIYKMIDDIISMGRHYCVSVIICAHNLTDYKKSKMQLAESHYLCLFPQSVSPKAMKYVCENYAGMDADDIKRLRTLGRWVCIHKTYPPFVLSQSEAFLLNQK
jgi:hypothetical protein